MSYLKQLKAGYDARLKRAGKVGLPPNSNPIENMETIARAFMANGFSKTSTAAILAILSKESGFMPVREKGYANTSVARIRQIFRKRLEKYKDEELELLKKDNEKFFDALYLGSNGNVNTGDGWKFRGGGFNQTTFRNIFTKLARQTGLDLVNNPELIEDFNNAVIICIQEFKNRIAVTPANLKKHYGTVNGNDFTNLETATNYFYHANAGWGRTLNYIATDHTGGRRKALSRVSEIYSFVQKL